MFQDWLQKSLFLCFPHGLTLSLRVVHCRQIFDHSDLFFPVIQKGMSLATPFSYPSSSRILAVSSQNVVVLILALISRVCFMPPFHSTSYTLGTLCIWETLYIYFSNAKALIKRISTKVRKCWTKWLLRMTCLSSFKGPQN